jgi:hypothetical protein
MANKSKTAQPDRSQFVQQRQQPPKPQPGPGSGWSKPGWTGTKPAPKK